MSRGWSISERRTQQLSIQDEEFVWDQIRPSVSQCSIDVEKLTKHAGADHPFSAQQIVPWQVPTSSLRWRSHPSRKWTTCNNLQGSRASPFSRYRVAVKAPPHPLPPIPRLLGPEVVPLQPGLKFSSTMDNEPPTQAQKKKRAYAAAPAYEFGGNVGLQQGQPPPPMMGPGAMATAGYGGVAPMAGQPMGAQPMLGQPQMGMASPPGLIPLDDPLASQFGQMNLQNQQQMGQMPQQQAQQMQQQSRQIPLTQNQLYPSDLISQPFRVEELDNPPPAINLPPGVSYCRASQPGANMHRRALPSLPMPTATRSSFAPLLMLSRRHIHCSRNRGSPLRSSFRRTHPCMMPRTRFPSARIRSSHGADAVAHTSIPL